VPVDAGVLGQPVGDEQAHPVALHHLDGGPGALAVVAPQMGLEAAAPSRAPPARPRGGTP
jgi:hypothetical protein